jgi:hypothetical protein
MTPDEPFVVIAAGTDVGFRKSLFRGWLMPYLTRTLAFLEKIFRSVDLSRNGLGFLCASDDPSPL